MLTYWETLIAKESNITVSDSYAELWGKKSQSGYTVETYTGTLPATLTGTKAGYLESYKIYGNTVNDGTPTPENPIEPSGCGERTANLWNEDKVTQIQVTSDASVVRYGIAFSGSAFALCLISGSNIYYKIKTGDTYGTAGQLSVGEVKTIFLTDNQTLLLYGESLTRVQQAIIQINSGTSYIPYGYKLPLTSGNTPVDIYIGDDTLSTDEYVDYGTQKIYKDVDIWNPNGTTINNQGETRPGNTLVGNIKYSLKNNSAYTFYYRIGTSSTSSTAISAGTELSITPSDTLYIWSPVSAGMSNFMAFTKQFVDPPAPFPQIPTAAGETTISWAGEGLAPSEVEFVYKVKG